MKKHTVVALRQPEGQDLLSTMLREGAQRLIAEALRAEFDEFLSQFAERCDGQGRAAVVRNGWQPQREVLTGLGPVGVRVPKARSRTEEPAVFRSALVPPYVRKAKAVDAALPWLYLHGVWHCDRNHWRRRRCSCCSEPRSQSGYRARGCLRSAHCRSDRRKCRHPMPY